MSSLVWLVLGLSLLSQVCGYAPFVSIDTLGKCAKLKPTTYVGEECVKKINSSTNDVIEFCQLPSSTCKSKFISYLRVLSLAACSNYNCSSVYYELAYSYAYDNRVGKFCNEFSDSELEMSHNYLSGKSRELNCTGITFCSVYWAAQRYSASGGAEYFQSTTAFINKLANCSASFKDVTVCETALGNTPKFSGSNSLCGTFARKSADF